MDSDYEWSPCEESDSQCDSSDDLQIKNAEANVVEAVPPVLNTKPFSQNSKNKKQKKKMMLHCAKCYKKENLKKGDKKEDDWIQCDGCTLWYHLACVDVEEFESKLIDKYHCKSCEEKLGKTIWKEIKVPHRYEFWNEAEKNKPTQVGTKPWIDEFIKKEKDFPLFEALKLYKNGYQFMGEFDQDKEWIQPLKILDPDGLEMKLPEVGIYIYIFDMDELLRIVGGDESINTIDVYMQQSSMMTMKKFFGRWMEEPRIRLFNMLSFEFSHTPLMDIVRAPALMYKLSWVHKLWPLSIHGQSETSSNENKRAVFLAEHLELKPDVAMFCLLGMAGSFTNFHIDFGGSSVWYHVYSGQKIFYVIEPTKENLEAFMTHRSEQFLNDLIPSKPMKKVVIEQGETLMIPSGWIHAVYTPVDSIVFGGNFIHELNIKKQLEVYDIELKSNLDDNFLYPEFELVNWYAALDFLDRFKSPGDQSPPPDVVEGFRALLPALRKWSAREKKIKKSPHNIFQNVISNLRKWLRAYGVQVTKPKTGPSSGNNISKKRKEIQRAEKADNHYAKMNGDNDISSDDDDTPKKKQKLSKPKEPKSKRVQKQSNR